jgi:hypothetical protein
MMLLRTTLAVAAFSLATLALPAAAQMPGGGIKDMMGKASDNALDHLSQPGAFSADAAIRIALPGAGGKGVGDLMNLANKAGLTGDISGALNHAAEQAAAQAKPIFRAAIDRVNFQDAVGMVTGGGTAATDYLRKATGTEINTKLLPLVQAALQSSGVLKQMAQLSSLGMNEGKLTDYVAGKTSDGIFTYVGREETKMRQNPLESGKSLLKGLKLGG